MVTKPKGKTEKRDYSVAELDILIEETQKMVDECNEIVFHYQSMIAQQDRYGFYYIEDKKSNIMN